MCERCRARWLKIKTRLIHKKERTAMKKIITIITLAALCLSLTACASNNVQLDITDDLQPANAPAGQEKEVIDEPVVEATKPSATVRGTQAPTISGAPVSNGTASPEAVRDAQASEARANETPQRNVTAPNGERKSSLYSWGSGTFEEIVLEFATDVVVAKYVGQRARGKMQNLIVIEYEFVVLERIFGDASDRIYVYSGVPAQGETAGGYDGWLNLPGGFTDSEYLLILHDLFPVYSGIPDDGYLFISSTVIDLDEPSRSVMRNEPLTNFSETLSTAKLSKGFLISYMKELAKNIKPPHRRVIKSDKTEDIIRGSSHVLVIEVTGDGISKPRNDLGSWDNYTCILVDVLKGDGIKSGEKFWVSFSADTVKPDERYIIAVVQLEEGSNNWFIFTSRNSLFGMERLEEIMRYC